MKGASWGLLVCAACGAEEQVAPQASPPVEQCRSFEQLMPRFVGALSTGKTENLKAVVETQLLKTPGDDVPPISDVLRIIFATLSGFASRPPEPGSTRDSYCALTPPPLNQANEVCEIRRAIDVLVHQGKGIEAVGVLEPQLQGVMDYLTGTGTSTDRQSHYEVASALSNMCSNTERCRLSNGLDLLIATSEYLSTAEGRKLVDDVDTLGAKPRFMRFLAPENLSEDGFVAIANTLISAVLSADAQALQNAFDQLTIIPDDVRADLQTLVADLKLIIARRAMFVPLQKTLNCMRTTDRNSDVIRMLYRLAIRDGRPEFGLTRLSRVTKQLQTVDERGSIVFLVNAFAKAVRGDEGAMLATATTCKTLFAASIPAGQSQSNAQQALPVVAELFRNGLVAESVCALDTFLFGCAGGLQPACPTP